MQYVPTNVVHCAPVGGDDELEHASVGDDLSLSDLNFDELLDATDLDAEIGGWFSSLGKTISHAAKTVTHTAGSVASTAGKVGLKLAKSPLVKVTAGAAAFVFPPVGVPLAAGVAAANVIAANVHSLDPRKRKAAKKVVIHTAAVAKKGDADARRGLKLLAAARKASKAKNRRVVFEVTRNGRILKA